MESALARELRENCGYLKEEGWVQSAKLMELAADEIDRLAAEVERLQGAGRRGNAPSAHLILTSMPLRRQASLGAKVRTILTRLLPRR